LIFLNIIAVLLPPIILFVGFYNVHNDNDGKIELDRDVTVNKEDEDVRITDVCIENIRICDNINSIRYSSSTRFSNNEYTKNDLTESFIRYLYITISN
jgi:hypothetical protein